MGRFHITKLFFVVLFLLETSRFCLCKNTSFDCFERERQALLNLKKSFIKDPSHILSSWEGTDCCQWKGVSCSTSNGHVVKLDLHTDSFQTEFFDFPTYKYSLVARGMNPSLLELKYLIHLDLSGNDFQGSTIPEFFGLMKQLEYLNLNNTNITGMVPHQLGNLTNLRVLDLNQMYIGWPSIEDLNWVSHLKSLRYVDVSGIDLSGARNLMEVLNMLPSLLELRLSNCMLNDSHLPRPFVNSTFMFAIQHLDLSHNSFSQRPLPIFLKNMTLLRVLDLSDNSFNSSIPLWLSNLKNLVHLDLEYNQFNGPIPASIGRLSDLRALGLSSNQLNGVIPATIGNLSALERLFLYSNQLNGVIPESLGQLSNLESLYLGSNSLEGTLSEIHFSNLSKLHHFHISLTHLSFNVKPEWVPPFQLSSIYMSSCKLQTSFPQWLETQKEVSSLSLSNASISEPLPNWLWSMQLRYLDLSHNRIIGPLPRNIGYTVPTLEYLYLADNLINGTIPISFCKIDTLISLGLSNNMLSGEIPNCWNSSNQLNALKLSSNKLTGVIPNSIGHLIELEWLHLKNNRLGGEVPSSLRNCRSLELLNLGENRFSGNIPTWIGQSLPSLQILRLQKNMFNGYIPQQLCQLTSLKVLDLAVNNLSGTIPRCFGNFSGMVLHQTTKEYISQYFRREFDEKILRLRRNIINAPIIVLVYELSIDLSDNNLADMIPEGLTILSGLIGMNLSHNNLTGNIPKGIGNLTSLISLDFSRNQLSGNIPTNMSDLTSLSHLNLSYNNFSGKIPTGPQLQTLLDPSIYAGNLELCGAPLPKICPGDEPSQAPIPDRNEENDEEDKSEKFGTSSQGSVPSTGP